MMFISSRAKRKSTGDMRHCLAIETLDARCLMATDLGMAGGLEGVVTASASDSPVFGPAVPAFYSGSIEFDPSSGKILVDGDNGADSVIVRQVTSGRLNFIEVEASFQLSPVYPWHSREVTFRMSSSFVSEVCFVGYGGDDSFTNEASVRSTAYGNQGDDLLIGGSFADVLRGGDGADIIYGHGAGDFLYGGQNDDLIFGGNGDDTIYGYAGDDSLYGGQGLDSIFGGAGTDGLYGGRDSAADSLAGGGGSDRFLIHDDASVADSVGTIGSQDVVVHFQDGDLWSSSSREYAAGEWTAEDVELVDQGLGVLHREVGNPTLLRLEGGEELVHVRQGDRISGSAAYGWNTSGDEFIYLTQDGFNNSEDRMVQTVIHEIGHNWDTENPDWEGFKELSGWTASDPGSSGYSMGTDSDEDWWYLTDAAFARAYAKTNPREDFACSFGAYFMELADRPYSDASGGADAIPEKVAFMEDFIDSIS